ncbi:hypothetical protein [Lyngbya sp. PCC 8106]|uniref:hypothetical protein n=1 Tax=Lyngbya sp. (strain PCC 8106) TaxID=313612 RepID=UPI0002D266B2|nr:hypothetical protein [Lyngbya sp. PCC 8106]
MINYNGSSYCLILAIDGNRKALDYYEDLARQGKKKSGIPFSSQRGTFICSEGIKICPYNEIFQESVLEDYSSLSDNKVQSHYTFMIEGSFQLVTNRNSISEASNQILKQEEFLKKIKNFLDKAWNDSQIFRELIERIGRQISDAKTDTQVKQFNQSKEYFLGRDFFHILDFPQKKEQKFFCPIPGEEQGLGALYTLLHYLVPDHSPYIRFWLRPLSFSAQGLDSLALDFSTHKVDNPEQLKGLEYKYLFTTEETFNHPLVITDQIICWEFDSLLEPGQSISDGNYIGEVVFPANDPKLQEIGDKITNIKNQYSSCHNNDVIVISLKELIPKTFNCDWHKGYLTLKGNKKKRRGKSKP